MAMLDHVPAGTNTRKSRRREIAGLGAATLGLR
jgi:hypothetical protein